MNSILHTLVSSYPNLTAPDKGVPVNLLSILQSNKHQAAIETLRNEPDEEKQKQLKLTLPCYTVAGVFSTRSNTGLVTPSNLACVDLDAAEDYDLPGLLTELRQIRFIAYAGLSCRGKRLFLIVPFATGAYEKHYESLIQSFKTMGIDMGDDCHKCISQARIVSYNTDTTHWFNHHAVPFKLLPKPKKIYLPNAPLSFETSTTNFNKCIGHINKAHTFQKGNRHHYIVALAGYCQWRGMAQNDTLTGCLSFAQPGFDAREIKEIVRYFYGK